MAGASGSDEGGKPAGGSVPFKPDYTAAREMTSCARTYARRGRDLSIALDFSDASIEAADEVAVRLWESMPLGLSETAAEEARGRLIFELGAYFGETFIQNHGGHWGWATMAGRKVFALRTESGFVAFPMNRARKRLRREEPDNLAGLYRFLSAARATLPGRPPKT